jgi:hypothetical protein
MGQPQPNRALKVRSVPDNAVIGRLLRKRGGNTGREKAFLTVTDSGGSFGRGEQAPPGYSGGKPPHSKEALDRANYGVRELAPARSANQACRDHSADRSESLLPLQVLGTMPRNPVQISRTGK